MLATFAVLARERDADPPGTARPGVAQDRSAALVTSDRSRQHPFLHAFRPYFGNPGGEDPLPLRDVEQRLRQVEDIDARVGGGAAQQRAGILRLQVLVLHQDPDSSFHRRVGCGLGGTRGR
jgi:hypothetical protein